MTILPFASLGFGIILGLLIKNEKFQKGMDSLTNVSLIFLMVAIGLGIGLNETIISEFPRIGLQCVVISLSAISFSILITYIFEKTFLPLKKIDDELQKNKIDIYSAKGENAEVLACTNERKKTINSLIFIMPIGLIVGIIVGLLMDNIIKEAYVDTGFLLSLIILYICVGVATGANKDVFKYLKKLGFKIIWLSVAILIGSLIGGYFAGFILGLPFEISVISSSGMSFYSITGAFMTSTYGLEAGTYGFLVNIMREFFTLIAMPLLAKISMGSPLAGGAAGNMDTMLAPITKVVGIRLGFVTLITGTILTLIVPFLLPILAAIV